MTKHSKRFALIAILTLCMSLCFGIVACGGDDDDGPQSQTVTYTVTVKTDDGAAASGVRVTIKKGASSFDPKTTDSTGKASFELAEDEYDVSLANLPSHYSVPADTSLKLTAANHDLTVTLEKNFTYVVKLVDPDGAPYYAEGVTVGVCIDGNCLAPVELASNGVAEIEVAKNNYHVQILDLPANAAYECDANGYYTGEEFSDTKAEMTITIYPVTPVDLSTTPMTTEEKEAYKSANDLYSYDTSKITRKISGGKLKKSAVAHFALTPDIAGDYMIFANDGASYLYQDKSFKLNYAGNAISEISLEAGETYYYVVTNTKDTEIDVEFILTSPSASRVATDGVGGTVTLTFMQEGAEATIDFTPTAGGKYTAKVEGSEKAKITVKNNAVGFTAESEYATDAAVSAKFTEANMKVSGTLKYTVTLTDVTTYPTSVKVKIEKVLDIHDTTNVIEVKEKLEQYTVPADKELVAVPLTSDTELVKNATDGYYHYGSADGPIVVVVLTESLGSDRFVGGCKLAYLEKVDPRVANYVLDVTEDKDDIDKGNTFNDYREFLRGFIDYEYKANMSGGMDPVIPDNKTVDEYYAKYVNKDGAYPLTDELKTFLQEFYTVNENILWASMPADAETGCKWMFPLYYYDDYTEPDAIVGEYRTAEGDFSLIINKRNTFVVYEISYWGPEEFDKGTWSNDEGVYTFTCESDGTLTYSGGQFSYDDGFGTEITLTPYVDPVVGEYEGTDGFSDFTLTVDKSGTYAIYEVGYDDEPYESGKWTKSDDYDYYVFSFEFYELTYTRAVYIDSDTGALEFCEIVDEEISFDTLYTFNVARTALYTYATEDESAKITLYEDGSFVLSEGRNNFGEFVYSTSASGTYDIDNTDGSITLNCENTQYGDTMSYEYASATSVLTVTITSDSGVADRVYEFDCSQD